MRRPTRDVISLLTKERPFLTNLIYKIGSTYEDFSRHSSDHSISGVLLISVDFTNQSRELASLENLKSIRIKQPCRQY